jgi:methionyl-tRNA formyltransferase
MKIIFMGTPEFAVASLEILLQHNYNVVGVVTAPDRPAGRGQQLQQSAIKKYALEKNLKVLQPEKLKDQNFLVELRALQADLQIVVAFRMLPEVVWNMPVLGTYNLHGSLLPKYRGAAPINWAIINGEKETGVTTFKLQHEIDSGQILFNEKVLIGDNETAGELHDHLMAVGAKLVLKTVKEIEHCHSKGDQPRFVEQDDSKVTHAPKLTRETARINWNNLAQKLHNLIRGLSPHPAAWCMIDNQDGTLKQVKIFKTILEPFDHSQPNGLLITDNNTFLSVYCKEGKLHITELQLEGKKRMPVHEFLKGHKIRPGALLL